MAQMAESIRAFIRNICVMRGREVWRIEGLRSLAGTPRQEIRGSTGLWFVELVAAPRSESFVAKNSPQEFPEEPRFSSAVVRPSI
jgi:hypothetical protein